MNNIIFIFPNVEAFTQANAEVSAVYGENYSDPTMIFNDGTYGMQKPWTPEAIAAITVPYTEDTYDNLLINPGRVFPPGDY